MLRIGSTKPFLCSKNGFTLIELIVVIAVVGILAGMAFPAFQGITRSSQLTSTANDIVSTLNFARNEAVTRSDRVTICRSVDGATCNTVSGYWEDGWIVFLDPLSSGTLGVVDDPSQIIRVYSGGHGGVTLRTGVNISTYLSFRENGIIRGHNGGLGNGTFRACDSRGKDHAFAVVISNTGRVRTQKKTTVCP